MEEPEMAKPLLTDELWERIRPLLPRERPKPKGGRPRIPDRQALTGILFVLRSGCPWEYLPEEMGCGCGMTCWRRLRDWHLAGVWEKVWRVFLDELGLADEIDWSKAVVDSCSVRAVFGGRGLVPIPPIAAKPARSGTSSATATGSRWRSSTPARMSTIRSAPSR
jgi:transposase